MNIVSVGGGGTLRYVECGWLNKSGHACTFTEWSHGQACSPQCSGEAQKGPHQGFISQSQRLHTFTEWGEGTSTFTIM